MPSLNIIVTAGPTREFLDDVRFLSNPSSGKMGYEIAEAAAKAEHDVVLVSGPVALAGPAGVETVRVVSAEEMARECLSRFDRCDAAVMTAAVCDYRPREKHAGKLKKTGGPFILELVPTTDILAEMGARKKGHLLVGFALEVQDARKNAIAKLTAKNLDFIVLNSPDSFASDTISCEIIGRQGKTMPFNAVTKRAFAAEIVKLLEKNFRGIS
jgi:phosphopantothenoylcysteine decarboxylase/phosphopantothenate--cysteine ligase